MVLVKALIRIILKNAKVFFKCYKSRSAMGGFFVLGSRKK
jgi:hypothetical protein